MDGSLVDGRGEGKSQLVNIICVSIFLNLLLEMFTENSKWNLGEDLYHVMLARGQVDDGVIRRHDQKTVSAELKGLGDVAPLESKSRLFIFLHGAFMLGAWICSASLGIIMARYES